MNIKKRVRVAFCIDSFEIGGTELNAIRTAESLDPDRVELSIIYLQSQGPIRERYERLGISMTHVKISNLYSPRTAWQGWRLARLIARQRIDVVHTHDIYTNIFVVPWIRLFTSSSIIASRRWWYEAPRPQLVTANRWCYKFAHRVLANSKGVAELLEREERVPKSKIVELPNFLDKKAFTRPDRTNIAEQRIKWGLPQDVFTLGIVARLSPVKNHAMLFRAMVKLEQRVHLVVVGDGPMRTELKELARELGLSERVHFVGEIIARENLHHYFDVSILCSMSEGFPNSVIEAMAAARPVVATQVGGVLDALQDGITGLLVPVDDPSQLASAIQQLIDNPALRERLGKAACLSASDKYRQEAVIERLTTLYEKLAFN